MSDGPAGRSLVTRRTIAEIARRAAIVLYGVVRLRGPRRIDDLAALLGRGVPGVRVASGAQLRIDLWLTVAFGVPVAEVARNVEEAVRHAVRVAIGREIATLGIHVEALGRGSRTSTWSGTGGRRSALGRDRR